MKNILCALTFSLCAWVTSASCSEGSQTLTVLLPTEAVTMAVTPETTIGKVKRRIAKSVGIPVLQQRLILWRTDTIGEVLVDPNSCAYYELAGKTVDLKLLTPPQER